MTSSFSPASLTYVPGLVGTSHLEDSTAAAGWTSLLVTHSRSVDACDHSETPETPDQMICLITGGTGTLGNLDDGRWRDGAFGVGSTYLKAAGERYRLRWQANKTGQPIERMHIFMPAALLADAAEYFRKPGQEAPSHSLSALAVRNGAMERVCLCLLRAMRAGEPEVYAEATADWLAVHLLSTLGDDVEDGRKPGRLDDARLVRALDFIDAHLASPIGLAEIAAEAGISKFHFARLFARAVGRTPIQYLFDRRLDTAAYLLETQAEPVSQVAFRCGFVNVAHFNRLFRQRFHCTPGESRHGVGINRSTDVMRSSDPHRGRMLLR